VVTLFYYCHVLYLADHACNRQFRGCLSALRWRIFGSSHAGYPDCQLRYRYSGFICHFSWRSREIPYAQDYLGRLTALRLTSRRSRRLAGLFPPGSMIKILSELASRALARDG
jgi:hypothetical protein